MRNVLALTLATVMSLCVAESATAADEKLPERFHGAFCGDKDSGHAPVGAHELSLDYSKALVADLRRREGAGLTTAAALAAMRAEYCRGNGDKETEK